MAKGNWTRDPTTGLPMGWLPYVETTNVDPKAPISVDGPEGLSDRADGRVFFHVNTAAWVVSGRPEGTDVKASYYAKKMLDDPQYTGEPVNRITPNGDQRLVGFLDMPNSLHAYGEISRGWGLANMLAGKTLVGSPC